MKAEAQRVAIGLACGWTKTPRHVAHETLQWTGPLGDFCYDLPDYLNSLDAIHEAEKTMLGKHWARYPIWLAKVIAGTQDKSRASGTRIYVPQSVLLSATAAQRAEAFLRTIGKWTTE